MMNSFNLFGVLIALTIIVLLIGKFVELYFYYKKIEDFDEEDSD